MPPALYTVPQTADVTDPVMASAVARFKLRSPKPEAITGLGSAAAPMPDATIGIHLLEAYAHVNSAMGDWMIPGAYLLQIDASLDGAALQLAAASLFTNRGLNRQAGADNTLDLAFDRAMAYLGSLTSPSRTRVPQYIDSSGSNTAANAPTIRSSHRSDDFVRRQMDGCDGPPSPWWPVS